MTVAITKIPGIGVKTAEDLTGHGFKTVAAVARSSVDKLSTVPGFGPSRSRAIIEAAKALLAAPAKRSPKTAGAAKTKKAARPGTAVKAAAGRKSAGGQG